MLFNTLSNVTNGSYCTEMLNRFLCYLVFPPCDQSSNIEVINPKSCQNYVVDGICAIHVEAMIEVLQDKNMIEIADNLRNCSSPLLEPDDMLSSSFINLPSNVTASVELLNQACLKLLLSGKSYWYAYRVSVPQAMKNHSCN